LGTLALCACWGIVLFTFLPDSPVSANFLSLDQRRKAVERLRSNQTGVENKTFKKHHVWEAVADYKLYLFFFLGFVANVPNGGISNFGTLIIKGFNFSTLNTTLLQIPYGIIISCSILVCVYTNDYLTSQKYNARCFMVILFLCPNIAGAFGLMFIHQNHQIARLMCYYLTGPYNAAFVLILSLSIGNVSGHTKKVFTNAVLFLGYSTANIAGPFFYKTDQAPTYKLGIASMIFSHLAEVILILILRVGLAAENRRRDKLQAGQERDLDATAFADMTDKENLNFRYVY